MVVAIWLTLVIGVVPLVGWLLWWWNDIWYGQVTATLRSSNGGMKLPPGHMGFPIIGEMLTFLWYFKVIRRPDDYINSKRSKYGDDIGMYKTHLYGKPSVIVFLPDTITFVFRDHGTFELEWPSVELVGETSMFAIHGSEHMRLRRFISKCLNQPDALQRAALVVQPRMISSLQSWAERGEVSAYKEIKNVTFENIGMYFASIEPGTNLDRLREYVVGVTNGFRSYRLNIPEVRSIIPTR